MKTTASAYDDDDDDDDDDGDGGGDEDDDDSVERLYLGGHTHPSWNSISTFSGLLLLIKKFTWSKTKLFNFRMFSSENLCGVSLIPLKVLGFLLILKDFDNFFDSFWAQFLVSSWMADFCS